MTKNSAAATADPKEGRQQRGPSQSSTEAPSRDDSHLARREPTALAPLGTPFALLRRFFTDDIESLSAFVPKIDVRQCGNELVVRADLPGVTSEDIVVEVGDDAITISGERQQERGEENGGIYRGERSYGAFVREIPLPDGAIADQAKASFKDGVLEITVPAPPGQVSRGRRLEISHGDTANKETSK
jgi:HSP20 family molecular chaperone IbpA